MGATGETPTRVSDEGFDPDWSPDGRQIVYTTERVTSPYSRAGLAYLWIVDIESGERRKLSDNDATGPKWSPTGNQIAFWTHYTEIQGQRDIMIIPAGGGKAVFVTRDRYTDWDPVWSPDARWLYFLSDRGGSADLWRIRVDPSTGEALGSPRPVTTGIASLTEASLSADGRRVAVTADRTSGEIVSLGFDPGTERVAEPVVTIQTSAHRFTQPDLSHDGEWIAYQAFGRNETIFASRIDGSVRRKLVDDEHRNRGPSWSLGDDWVGFYSNRDGVYNIWAIRPDGTGLRRLTDAKKADYGLGDWWPGGNGFLVSITEDPDWAGVLDFGDEGIDGLEGTIEATRIPGTEGFSGNDGEVSPDELFLSGVALDPLGERSRAVYSFEKGEYELLRHADGSLVRSYETDWVDSRRLMFWDVDLDSAVVWDLERRELRTVEGVPGPGDILLTPDRRTLLVNRYINESEIWLLTLAE
jgi:Tol biopolymer transport system component